MKIGEDVVLPEVYDIRYGDDRVEIGNHVAIDSYFCCSTKLKIKDYVHIGPLVSIIGGKTAYCEIGNFSGMAAGCRIICASDEYLGEGIINPLVPDKYKDNIICEPVIFENFVTLATNTIVFPGVRLAEGSVVGAGSVVTKSTKPWTVYAGNPARPIRERKKEVILQYAKEMGY